MRQGSFAELQRIIREEDPARPSTRLRSVVTTAQARPGRPLTTANRLPSELSGDLEWITLKALEKDRARRCATVSELAADITRYLHHEPVDRIHAALVVSNAIQLYKIATGRVVRALEGSEDVEHQGGLGAPVFSRDGRLMAAPAYHSIDIWDAATGRKRVSLPCIDLNLLNFAFNRDGTSLVSASADGTVTLWNALTGSQILTLQAGDEREGIRRDDDDGRLPRRGRSAHAACDGNDVVGWRAAGHGTEGRSERND